MRRPAAALAALCLAAVPGCGADAATVFHVTLGAGLGPALGASASGRLLVFAQPLADAQADAKGAPLTEIDAGEFHPRAVAVAAREVDALAPGGAVDVDADTDAFPQGFSRLKPGRYAVQAVLDRDHSYAYGGRGPGDVVSPVVALDLPAGGALTLGEVQAPRPRPAHPARRRPRRREGAVRRRRARHPPPGRGERRARRVLGQARAHARLGGDPARLRPASRPALSHRVLDPRLRRHDRDNIYRPAVAQPTPPWPRARPRR